MLPHDLPARLGRYELQRILGVGGMGRVLSAYDPVLQRSVAVKVIEPGRLDADGATQVRFLFHREARAIAALRHPNVLEIYDYSGADAEHMYIACELVAAPTLAQRLEATPGMAQEQAAALGYEIAQALEHAHDRGIVHRDLKPDNIFWCDSGRIVLADFGIAKAFDGRPLASTIPVAGTRLFGSPRYMAPELLDGVAASPASDAYALGCILYECIAGRPVFPAQALPDLLDAVRSGIHEPLRQVRDDLRGLIEALLSRDGAQRPSSTTLTRALRTILDLTGVADPRLALRRTPDATAVITPTPPAPTKQDRLGWHMAAALLAATVCVLAYKWWPRPLPDVATRLVLPGPTEVFLDGRQLGTFIGEVHVALPAGRHTLTTRRDEDEATQTIYLVPETQPTFDLTKR